MSAPLPHNYEISFAWTGGSEGVARAGPRPGISVSPQPEWDGTDRHWSPEHLLLAAASSCLMTTFAAVAKKSQLAFSSYEATSRGTLDKTANGIVFTSLVTSVTLRVWKGDAERAGRALDLAKKHCIVSNSLRSPVTVESRIIEE